MEKNVKDFMIKNLKLTALTWKTAMSSKYGLSDSLKISPAGTLHNNNLINKYLFTIKLNKQLEKRINKHLNTIIDQQ